MDDTISSIASGELDLAAESLASLARELAAVAERERSLPAELVDGLRISELREPLTCRLETVAALSNQRGGPG